MTDTPPGLWKFAIRVYDRTEIAALCLRLQDDHGFDVNLLLSCLWHGQYYGNMDAELVDEALAFSSQWQEQVVAPLRRTRRWLKQQLRESGELNGGTGGNRENKENRETRETRETDTTSINTLREQVKACELAGEQHQLAKLESLILSAIPKQADDRTNPADAHSAVINNLLRLQERMSRTPKPRSPGQNNQTQALNELAERYCQGD